MGAVGGLIGASAVGSATISISVHRHRDSASKSRMAVSCSSPMRASLSKDVTYSILASGVNRVWRTMSFFLPVSGEREAHTRRLTADEGRVSAADVTDKCDFGTYPLRTANGRWPLRTLWHSMVKEKTKGGGAIRPRN